MKTKSHRFLVVDILLLLGAALPLVAGLVLRVFTKPPSNGIEISGALVYATIPLPFQDLPITEAQINSALVIVTLLFVCLYFTHGLKTHPELKRQLIAEWIVETCDGLVNQNMGEYFTSFSPFIVGIMGLSAFSSLLSLIGLYPPTSDINITAGWAILVFFLITFYKLKSGFGNYLKSFTEPIVVLLPLNILGEVATPVSMAFRHFGNVLSGSVIAVLISTALQGLSAILLSWLPGVLGEIPFLQIGIPAVLSLYFDIFSGALQAFIFAMLTMLNIAGAFSPEEYEKRQRKKQAKKLAKINGGIE